ncbi:MAG: late competence development ComFB family protein [Candidatus Sericytochromatia bacterium]
MTQNQNYQKHIERAIQNVLTKVRHPSRSAEDSGSVSTGATVGPAHIRPAPRRDLPESHHSASTAPVELAFPNTLSSPTSPQPAAPAVSMENDPLLVEAEDLYTHQLVDETASPEHPEETPLQEDDYHAPYNLFEEFVETELNILLSRYLDLCRCGQCRSDIVALALQQLPAYYVTGTRGTLTAKSVVWTRYMQQIMDAVTKAIHVVYKRPRSSCRKIKQVLWVRPELEEVNSQQYFEQVYQEDIQLDFSPEVSDIIHTLEQSSEADKNELLPLSSPWVQQAYQQYQPEAPATPHEINKDAIPSEGSATAVLNLLDIDDWDTQKDNPA